VRYKRVVVSRYGGPEVLEVVEDEVREPAPGEVGLRVLAAGVAWGDVLKREGLGRSTRPPFTPGYDVVGVVDTVGPGVTAVKVGQTVAALPLTGCYAERVWLPASTLVPVPPGLDPAETVCLVMNYVVAHQVLHRAARVAKDDRVLVYSAAGGVGTAVLQLGRLADLSLYGAASVGKHTLVSALGAHPLDDRSPDFTKQILAMGGVDVVLDPMGGTHLGHSYRLLRGGGRLVVYGAHRAVADGKLAVVTGLVLSRILDLLPDGRSVMTYGVTRPPYSSPAWCRDDLAAPLTFLERRDVQPIIAHRLPLTEARRAHALLESGASTGKVVLVQGGP